MEETEWIWKQEKTYQWGGHKRTSRIIKEECHERAGKWCIWDAFEARDVDEVKQEAAHKEVSKVREDKARW